MQSERNARIADCLDRICAATIDGRLGELEALETELAGYLAEHQAGRSDQDELRGLMQRATRSRRLLVAAGRGVRLAQRRLAEIRRATGGLETYDQGGQMSRHNDTSTSLTRRF